MKKKYKVEVDKCYLISIVDEKGNQVSYDYVFGLSSKHEAIEYGKKFMLSSLKDDAIQENKKNHEENEKITLRINIDREDEENHEV